MLGKRTEEWSRRPNTGHFSAKWASSFRFPSWTASVPGVALAKKRIGVPPNFIGFVCLWTLLVSGASSFKAALPPPDLQTPHNHHTDAYGLSYVAPQELPPDTYGLLQSGSSLATINVGGIPDTLSFFPTPGTQLPVAFSDTPPLRPPLGLVYAFPQPAPGIVQGSNRPAMADRVSLSKESKGSDKRAKSMGRQLSGGNTPSTPAMPAGSASPEFSSPVVANDAETRVDTLSSRPPITTLLSILSETSAGVHLSLPMDQNEKSMASTARGHQAPGFQYLTDFSRSSDRQKDSSTSDDLRRDSTLKETDGSLTVTNFSGPMTVDLGVLALSRCAQSRPQAPAKTRTGQARVLEQSEAVHEPWNPGARQDEDANVRSAAIKLQFLSVDWFALSREGSHTLSPVPSSLSRSDSSPSESREVSSKESSFLKYHPPPPPSPIGIRATDCALPSAECATATPHKQGAFRADQVLQRYGLPGFPRGVFSEEGRLRQHPDAGGGQHKSAVAGRPVEARHHQESLPHIRPPTGSPNREHQFSSIAAKFEMAARAAAESFSSDPRAPCPDCPTGADLPGPASKQRRPFPMPERKGTLALLRCVKTQDNATAEGTQQRSESPVLSATVNARGDEDNEELKLVEDDLFGFIPVQLLPVNPSLLGQAQGVLNSSTALECLRASLRPSAELKHGLLTWTAPQARRWFETVLLSPGRKHATAWSPGGTVYGDSVPETLSATASSEAELPGRAGDQEPSEQAHQRLSATPQNREGGPLELPVWVLEVPLSGIVDTERLTTEAAACREAGASSGGAVPGSDGAVASLTSIPTSRGQLEGPPLYCSTGRVLSAFWHPSLGRLMEAQLNLQGLETQCILSKCGPHEADEKFTGAGPEAGDSFLKGEPNAGGAAVTEVLPGAESSCASSPVLLETVWKRGDCLAGRSGGSAPEPDRRDSAFATGGEQIRYRTQASRYWIGCSCGIPRKGTPSRNYGLHPRKNITCLARLVPVCTKTG